MPPVGRKVPKEVQAIFDKYKETNIATRLKKPEAIRMMSEEFGLTEEQGEKIFETFDQDKNGIMSLWEFEALYTTVGDSAQEIVKKFEEMDVDGSGKLDASEARAGLKQMKTTTGRDFEDREIDFFLKSNTGEDGMIDLGRFVQMLFRLKMYKPKPKK
ncbi:uncharacterized protein LOC135484897 [Lineus longissimus]|uniref:uncharacterized protein LOC135484897 n=1 Tax=Lineus longissimus TaxID=88925 RepID=UPI002B4D3439